MDRTSLRLLTKALKRSADVTSVEFHNAALTADSIDVLHDSLPQTSVRSLKMDYDVTSEQGAALSARNSTQRPALYASLIAAGSNLTALSLRGNTIDDDGAALLAKALGTNTTLCSLNLFDNIITDTG